MNDELITRRTNYYLFMELVDSKLKLPVKR